MSYVSNPRCPNCGAPVAAPSATRAMRCSFCSVLLTPDASSWRALPAGADDEPLPDPELPRLWVGGLRYALLGRLARGTRSRDGSRKHALHEASSATRRRGDGPTGHARPRWRAARIGLSLAKRLHPHDARRSRRACLRRLSRSRRMAVEAHARAARMGA